MATEPDESMAPYYAIRPRRPSLKKLGSKFIQATEIDKFLAKLTKKNSTFIYHELVVALDKKKHSDREKERNEFCKLAKEITGKDLPGEKQETKELAQLLVTNTLIGLNQDIKDKSGKIVKVARRYAPRGVLGEESRIIDSADRLNETRKHFVVREAIDALLTNHDRLYPDEPLNTEQREAVRRMTAAGGLALLAGEAGTGKSTVLSVVRKAYEKQGRRVVGLSWTNAVVEDLRTAGFSNANTIYLELRGLEEAEHKELKEKVSGDDNAFIKWDCNTVIVVDEAAMLPNECLHQLLQEANKIDAKIILVGDQQQLASIDRGGMFGVLVNMFGATELHEIVRVRDEEQKRAFNHMHSGGAEGFKKALMIFSNQGAIHASKSRDEAFKMLIANWEADFIIDPSKSRMVLAQSVSDMTKLNVHIRAVRDKLGHLEPPHQLFSTEVKERGATIKSRIAVAKGDRLQFRANDKKNGIFNGRVGTVVNIEGTVITLRQDSGKSAKPGPEITFDARYFKAFSYGDAITIYRSQGKTFDQTYLLHSIGWHAAESYVALTRHRDRLKLFYAAAKTENLAENLDTLAKQMSKIDSRGPGWHFHRELDEKLVQQVNDLGLGRKPWSEKSLPQLAGTKRRSEASFSALGPRVKRLKTEHSMQEMPAGRECVEVQSLGSAFQPETMPVRDARQARARIGGRT